MLKEKKYSAIAGPNTDIHLHDVVQQCLDTCLSSIHVPLNGGRGEGKKK